MKALHPLIIPDGAEVGKRVLSSSVPKVMFLPKFASPPVGWFFKATTTFENYVQVFENTGQRSPYTNHSVCLEEGKQLLKPWFEAVNKDPAPLRMNLIEGALLLDHLPTRTVPNPPTIDDVEELDPV